MQFNTVVSACPEIDCHSPPAVNGAQVLTPDGTKYGAVVQYKCVNRLVFGGVPGQKTAEATCQENGHWSDVIETCQGSTCSVDIVFFKI